MNRPTSRTTPRAQGRGAARSGLSRRGFLAAGAGLGAAAMFGRHASAQSLLGGRRASGGAGSLVFDNWPEYIDLTDGGELGTVDRFIEATGIDLTYNEVINDNNSYFAVIQPLLGRGQTIEADIIAPTSWMAGRLINLGWVDPLPIDQIPNAANLRDDLVNPGWDPTGEFSLPWQTGFAGIAYNIAVTGRELHSTEEIFDPEFAGRVGMLTEMRDTLGLLMLAEGVDISTLDSFDQAAGALERLEAAKASGHIRAFTGNDYIGDLQSGNFAACFGWSGDVAALGVDNPDIRFVIPEEGGTSWADTMLLPKGAVNVEQALRWMDFVYDPVEAAKITAYVQFVSPVEGVRDEVAKIDPELAESPLVFPDDETLARTHTFASLSEDLEAELDAAFAAITGA